MTLVLWGLQIAQEPSAPMRHAGGGSASFREHFKVAGAPSGFHNQ